MDNTKQTDQKKNFTKIVNKNSNIYVPKYKSASSKVLCHLSPQFILFTLRHVEMEEKVKERRNKKKNETKKKL